MTVTVENLREQLKKEFRVVLWEVYSAYTGPEDVIVQALFAKEGIHCKEVFAEACREWIKELDETKGEFNEHGRSGTNEQDTTTDQGIGGDHSSDSTDVRGEETGNPDSKDNIDVGESDSGSEQPG